jgi:5'-deoxynucleotidase YfbR-like HD superfamily hydrolase
MNRMEPIIKLAADFAGVMRVLRYREGHIENDAEHSYQLAIVSWSANHQYNLRLDDEKILKYALVHDLVEIYAGDTDAFGDAKKLAAKHDKEVKALKQLQKNYHNFPEIVEATKTYEQRQELETRLVNIFDKVIADENIYQSKDDYYLRMNVTYEQWKERILMKINYPTLPLLLKPLVDEWIVEVKNRERDIFYKGAENS